MNRRERRAVAPDRPPFAHRRGVGFIWFLLVAVPFFFVSAFISVDVSRLYLAKREAINVAEAAAVAGAFSFTLGQSSIDTGLAVANANDTIRAAVTAGATRHLTVVNQQITFGNSIPPREVAVTVNYVVNDLVFLGGFFRLIGQTPSSNIDGQVTREAFLCRTDRGGGAGPLNICTRPMR